jgi:nitrogenase molybdenum-iron protein alpha chain
MALLDTKRALAREKRNGTLSHYNGTLVSLLEDTAGTETPQRIRTFSQSAPGEIIYALRAVLGIPGSVTVIHGGIGCSASGAYFTDGCNVKYYTTNLNESDTILGGEEKLKTAVAKAYRENHPQVVFIVGTPINAINNDDVESVILELGEYLNCGIVYIDVNGFKTKNALSGYDAVYHGFLKYLVRPKQPDPPPFINLLTLSENPVNILAVVELLGRLDIPCNICPRCGGIGGIARASEARFSLSLDDAENEYFLLGLEEQFGVPWIKTSPPVGAAAIRDFVKKTARAFGSEGKADALLEEEERKITAVTGRKPLGGRKVCLSMDLHRALGFAELIGELGGEVSGIAIPHLDSGNAGGLKALSGLPRIIPLLIAQGQQFELVNALSKHRADFFIGGSEDAPAAASAGALPLALDTLIWYGYEGIAAVAGELQKASASGPKDFVRSTVPYSETWLKRSGNWYVKIEVK